jgi:hypothetical protein
MYICEQAFSRKKSKSNSHSETTYVHLHDVMQIGISEMESNVIFLVEQSQAQVYINTVSLGYFYCYG